MRKYIYYLLFIKKFFYILIYQFFTGGGKLRLNIRRNIENYLIFQPSRLRAVRIKRSILKYIQVQRFFTDDRVRLFGWYIAPRNENPVFLFFHGQAESILSHQDIAEFCIKNGLGLFLLSYRGHYKSSGQPSERGTFKDAQAALRQLEKLGIMQNRVILWGHSYGSVVAVETALNSDVQAVILQSAIKDLKSAIKDVTSFIFRKLKFFDFIYRNIVEKIVFISKLDNISKIEKINIPILIMHAKPDIMASYKNSLELAEKNNSAKLFISPTGSHWKSGWCFNAVFEFVKSLEYNNSVEKID